MAKPMQLPVELPPLLHWLSFWQGVRHWPPAQMLPAQSVSTKQGWPSGLPLGSGTWQTPLRRPPPVGKWPTHHSGAGQSPW